MGKLNAIVLTTLIWVLTFQSTSCQKDDGNADSYVLYNGHVYTADSKQTTASAIFIKDGRIEFIGSDDEAQKLADGGTREINLKGRMVMPGIHDVHQHPLEAMSQFTGTCILSSEETDPERFIRSIKRCAPNQTVGEWVFGWGHSIYTLLEAERPPVEILDEAIPDRPAIFMEETSHSVWLNSKGLEKAGITKDTPNPPGGIIVKDPETGEPNGILFDAAGDMVLNEAWPATAEIMEQNYQGLLLALDELQKYGITSVCEARTYWKRKFQDAWKRAEDNGKLTVRVVLDLWAYPSMDDDEQLSQLKSLYSNNVNSLIRANQIKVYSDGITINTTAALLEPYDKVVGEIGSNNGLNYFSEERLKKYIAELDPYGFDFHIHAIGDRGIRESLNAIEASQVQGRHRITHLEIVKPADYPRFKQLNVTADMQVAGDFTQPDNWGHSHELIGDRSSPTVPLKDLYDAGARITLSSDWDVSELNPFLGMQNALTRSPQALPNLHEIIKAYTINAAYVMRQEDVTGSLEVGKDADLIILDRNLFEEKSKNISLTRVDLTMLKGNVVYER